MPNFRRRVFLVDPQVQGALMFRVTMYWAYCLLTITIMLLWWTVFTGPARPFIEVFREVFQRFMPAAAASSLMLPLVVMDVLRLSNRFVGPMMRVRGALRDLAEGENVASLSFRDNDYWRELATDFNRIAQRLKHLETGHVLGNGTDVATVAPAQRESQPVVDVFGRSADPLISASTAVRA